MQKFLEFLVHKNFVMFLVVVVYTDGIASNEEETGPEKKTLVFIKIRAFELLVSVHTQAPE